jgi:hypothetical protein
VAVEDALHGAVGANLRRHVGGERGAKILGGVGGESGNKRGEWGGLPIPGEGTRLGAAPGARRHTRV